MKIVEELKGFSSNHLIINGDGTYPDKMILERICEKYNGVDKVIWYPRTPIKKQTGLSALNLIIENLSHGFCKIIFIVDGEHIKENPDIEIKKKLNSIGVNVTEITPLQDAFLIKCRHGNYNINLYCIISGPRTCIEEEVAKLIELQLNIRIDLSGNKNHIWRHRIKREIDQILNEKGKTLKQLLKETGRRKFEISFPNICAVLRKVEEEF